MDTLRSTLWVGSTYSHVETVVQCLLGGKKTLPRPMAVYREGNCVLTPGEYIENPWYFSALLVSSYDVDTVVLGYRLGEPFNPYPPATAGAFNRNVVGVVIMNDALDTSQIGESVRLLRLAGANDICVVMESEEDVAEQNLIQDIPMVTYGYEALREMLSVKE